MNTPDNIQELKPNEIFVFGSNMAGNHVGGAAKLAHEKFGAKWGEGNGMTGQCYAFPTLNEDLSKRTLPQIRDSIMDLYECVMDNPEKTFFVTKVGCGIAGYSMEQMRALFQEFDKPGNVVLPKEFELIGE